MSVYVDPLCRTPRSRRWKWACGCHLTADSIDELHTFAARLGLKPAWFQPYSIIPHYDITENKRRQAVRLGAIELDRREAGRRIHAARQARLAQGAAP